MVVGEILQSQCVAEWPITADALTLQHCQLHLKLIDARCRLLTYENRLDDGVVH